MRSSGVESLPVVQITRRVSQVWHEAAVPAACAMFRSWGESGCAVGAPVSSAHDPNRSLAYAKIGSGLEPIPVGPGGVCRQPVVPDHDPVGVSGDRFSGRRSFAAAGAMCAMLAKLNRSISKRIEQ